jgi:hypothetical protein
VAVATPLLAGLRDPRCDSIQQAVEPECEAVVSGQVHPGSEVLGGDAATSHRHSGMTRQHTLTPTYFQQHH